MEGTRRINELIAAGVLGPIREVHMWTDRPQRFWAQGIPRPGTPIPTPTTPPDPSVPPRWNMRTVDNAVLRAMADESADGAARRALGSLPRPHDAPDRRITRPITRSAGAATSTSA